VSFLSEFQLVLLSFSERVSFNFTFICGSLLFKLAVAESLRSVVAGAGDSA